MTKKQFIESLPIKFKVTKEIIEKGKKNLYNGSVCIGALSLKAASGVRFSKGDGWGVTQGYLSVRDRKYTIQATDSKNQTVDMTELDNPKVITFKLV